MTNLKPEDLVKRVEDMADFLVGDKGVFLSADVADEHAADLRALLADRARMEKALRNLTRAFDSLQVEHMGRTGGGYERALVSVRQSLGSGKEF